MKSFEEIISLLNPDEKYNPVLKQCQQLWVSFSSEKQDFMYRTILEKKERKEFVDYNPLFALKRTYRAPKPLILSYADYYAKFGTTEERDGWHMENPTGQKVIYVKTESGCCRKMVP